MCKVVTVHEAVTHINDNDILAISGMLFVAGCEPFYEALESRFLSQAHPQKLTLYAASSIGSPYVPGWPPDMANRLAHKGLVSKIITSLYSTMPSFHESIHNDDIEAYLVPQGTFSQIVASAARRIPYTITQVGLHTYVDPRCQGGKLNDVSREDLCEVVSIGNEEFLSYKTIYPNVCIIRGTSVDRNGNITFEEECGEFDALQMAMATKNNNGTVIVQVKKQIEGRSDPQLVRLPSALVDFVYVYPNQSLTLFGKYDPRMNGADWTDDAYFEQTASYLTALSENNRDIIYRACAELKSGYVVNLGIGTPYPIGLISKQVGIKDVHFTNEIGLFGGYGNFRTFGLNFNTDMMMSQGAIKNFYEGGGLDISFAGALEVDIYGCVNVLRTENRLFGIGGFNSITHNAKEVVFCFDFLDKYGKCKIVDAVRCINYTPHYKPDYQKVLYITERCVLELQDGVLVITEINPKYDLEKDILPYLNPEIKCNVRRSLYGTFCNC